MTIEKQKDKIAKPVYFNVTNEKENEIVEWLDSKFSTFGGLVKDLLYREMLKEKSGIKSILIQDVDMADIDINKIEVTSEKIVDSSEVEDIEC